MLPAMQSLIHGNFEGAAQKKAYALVGAAAAIAAAVGPLLGGFITTYLTWRLAFALEVVVIVVVLSGMVWSATCPTRGLGTSTRLGPSCPSLRWAASCSASWSGRRAARPSPS
jgi:MFS family permease